MPTQGSVVRLSAILSRSDRQENRNRVLAGTTGHGGVRPPEGSDGSGRLLWIEALPTLLRPRAGRRALVVTSRDGVWDRRDGSPRELLVRSFPVGMKFVTVPAHRWEEPVALPRDVGVVAVIGRPRTVSGSRHGKEASALERSMVARFFDAPSGRSADSVQYPDRMLTRRQCGEDAEGHRLFDLEYGFVVFRRLVIDGVERLLIGLYGLGSLATAGVTKIVCEPRLLAELRRQVERLVGVVHDCRWQEGFELCVKIEVPDRSRLDDIANELTEPVPVDLGGLPFRFAIEAVAIARADGNGHRLWMAPRTAPPISLRIEPDGIGVATFNGCAVRLRENALKLVEELNAAPGGVAKTELCDALAFPATPKGRRRLVALVNRTNDWIRRCAYPGQNGVRAIQSKAARYVLVDAPRQQAP